MSTLSSANKVQWTIKCLKDEVFKSPLRDELARRFGVWDHDQQVIHGLEDIQWRLCVVAIMDMIVSLPTEQQYNHQQAMERMQFLVRAPNSQYAKIMLAKSKANGRNQWLGQLFADYGYTGYAVTVLHNAGLKVKQFVYYVIYNATWHWFLTHVFRDVYLGLHGGLLMPQQVT